MADFDARNNNRGKYFCSGFLFRLLLIALFLSVLPLFTSEAPEFISHTIFAKSWELVHLFIIGILVSYGLFGRRKTHIHYPSNNLIHASSIFNFEHQHPSVPSGYENDNGTQASDFRQYGLEPTVVVRPGTFDLDYEPLDLPVRSLRSRVEESDSEEFANESEIEADRSSCGCSDEDNESENFEENVVDPSPTPWNWPNSAQNSYLSSPGINHEVENGYLSSPGHNPEVKQASSLSTPLWSSESDSPSMDRENSWREDVPARDEPMPYQSRHYEVKHENSRSSRPSSSKNSSPFSHSFSESSTSLKSRSMRMDFEEKVGDVSLPVDDQGQNIPHSQSFRSPESVLRMCYSMPPSSSEFSLLCTDVSQSPASKTENLQRGIRKRQHSQSFRSPKAVSPVCNFMPPSLSEFSPLCSAVSGSQTTVMEDLQRERKQDDDCLLSKRVGSRSQRSRKREDFGKDAKDEMKMRTVGSRSESSCDRTSSAPSCDFTSATEPKSGRYTDRFYLDENVHIQLTTKQSPDSGISKETESTEIEDSVSENRPFMATSTLNGGSFRSQKSVSPVCNFMPPSLSEFSPLCSAAASESPTTLMEDLQSENKEVEKGFLSKRVGSRSRRSRKRDNFGKDVKAEMKMKTVGSRSESSCDTTSSTPSHDFTSTIEPKSSRYTDRFSLDENVPIPPESLTTKESPDSSKSKEVENTEIKDFVSENIPFKATSPGNGSTKLTSTQDKEAEHSPVSNERERKPLSRTTHSRRFSCGSFFDRDLWKGSKGETKEITKKGNDETSSYSGKCRWDCLTLDVKPTVTKSSVRGKSVRTVRPQAITLEPSCTNENESQVGVSQERVRERQDVVIISIGISEKNARNARHVTEQSNDRNQNNTKLERMETSFLELGRDKDGSNGKTSVMEDVNEDEDYISEIDKKADEFIAKFKEQIRLQKVASRRESSKHRS